MTIWSGKPEYDTDQPDANKSLPEISRFLQEQKYKEASLLTTGDEAYAKKARDILIP